MKLSKARSRHFYLKALKATLEALIEAAEKSDDIENAAFLINEYMYIQRLFRRLAQGEEISLAYPIFELIELNQASNSHVDFNRRNLWQEKN